MQKEASKNKVGNSAMFTPQEGFEIVMKYFGIEATAPLAAPPAARSVPTPSIQPKVTSKPAIDFDIKLEDLF